MSKGEGKKPQYAATLLGFSALFLWAMSSFVISELEGVPTFQVSATVLVIAFIFTAFFLTIKGEWHRVKQPKRILFFGFMVILVNQASFVYAVKLIPPEQAEIIYYLWPIMTIVASALFFENKKPMVPVLSSILGLAGVYILLCDDGGIFRTKLEYSDGYLFAFAAALAWMLYSLFARYHPHIPLEMNGIWCGLSALACIGIHLYFEHTVMPTPYEWMLMGFIGVFILVFSLKMWATGMRHGHFNLLTVFSYMTPLLSVMILILFEKTPFQGTILIACQLIILGGILCTLIEWIESRKKSNEEASVKETSYLE